MSTAWQELRSELDAWQDAGRAAEIWWRDDDATAATPALARLLDLAAGHGVPLALAVIPAQATQGLAELLQTHPAQTTVLQHGYRHQNHAAPSAKKCELVSPAERPDGPADLRRGMEILLRLFAGRSLPVLVPPWNRIAPDLAGQLATLGFGGLSTYTARIAREPAPCLVQVNCHLDLLRWCPVRGFLGTEAALELLIGHLAAKRCGRADADEPSGILSHHAAHDEAAWSFLDRLLSGLVAHPAVRLRPAAALFPLGAGAGSDRKAAR